MQTVGNVSKYVRKSVLPDSLSSYFEDELVLHNGVTYRATKDTIAFLANSTAWQLAQTVSNALEFKNGILQLPGEVIETNDGSIFQRNIGNVPVGDTSWVGTWHLGPNTAVVDLSVNHFGGNQKFSIHSYNGGRFIVTDQLRALRSGSSEIEIVFRVDNGRTFSGIRDLQVGVTNVTAGTAFVTRVRAVATPTVFPHVTQENTSFEPLAFNYTQTEFDEQTLSYDPETGSLVISNGNTVNIANQAVEYFSDLAAFEAATPTSDFIIITDGAFGGLFIPSQIAKEDGIVYIEDASGNFWERTQKYPLDWRWFGAVGDGVTDNTQSLRDAVDYVALYGGAITVFNTGNPYLVNGRIDIDDDFTLTSPDGATIEFDAGYLNVLSTSFEVDLASSVASRSRNIPVTSTANINAGDLAIVSGKLAADEGWKYPYHETHEVDGVSGGEILTSNESYFGYTPENFWRVTGSEANGNDVYYPAARIPSSEVEVRNNGTLLVEGVDYTVETIGGGTPSPTSGDPSGLNFVMTSTPTNSDTFLFQQTVTQKVSIVTPKRVVIEGINFMYSTGGAITLSGVKNSIISNCTFKTETLGQDYDAIRVQSSIGVTLKDLYFENTRYACLIIGTRNVNLTRIRGNNVRHLSSSAVWCVNTTYDNFSGTNMATLHDAHPSINSHFKNTTLGIRNGPNLRTMGGSFVNIHHVDSEPGAVADYRIGFDWIEGGGPYGWERPDNIAAYPFKMLIDNYVTDVTDNDQVEFRNQSYVEIRNSSFNSAYQSYENGPSNMNVLISDSRIDRLRFRDAGEVMINNSLVGELNLGAYHKSPIEISDSRLGMFRDGSRALNFLIGDFGLGEVQSSEASERYFTSCDFVNIGPVFQADVPRFSRPTYVFKNCNFDGVPFSFENSKLGTASGINSDYFFQGLETSTFQNSPAGILWIDVNNGGSGYDPATTTITIEEPDQTDINRAGWSFGRYWNHPDTDQNPGLVRRQGIQATAVPIIESGVIVRVIITNAGEGYRDANKTSITVNDPSGGTGASLSIRGRYPRNRVAESNESYDEEGLDKFILRGGKRIGSKFIQDNGSGELEVSDSPAGPFTPLVPTGSGDPSTWSTFSATQPVDMDGNTTVNLPTSNASGQAVEHDQFVGSHGISSRVFFTTPSTFTPDNTGKAQHVEVLSGTDTLVLDSPAFDGQELHIKCGRLAGVGNPVFIETLRFGNGDPYGFWLQPNQSAILSGTGVSNSWRLVSKSDALRTGIDATIISSADTIHPSSGRTYIIDASAAAGPFTVDLAYHLNQLPSLGVASSFEAQIYDQDLFKVRILGADVNAVTLRAYDADDNSVNLLYSTIAGSATEVFSGEIHNLIITASTDLNGSSTTADVGFYIED